MWSLSLSHTVFFSGGDIEEEPSSDHRRLMSLWCHLFIRGVCLVLVTSCRVLSSPILSHSTLSFDACIQVHN